MEGTFSPAQPVERETHRWAHSSWVLQKERTRSGERRTQTEALEQTYL